MEVTRLRIVNYRNYQQCELDLSSGRNIFVGENAQGKTNLLEVIELLSSGKSGRANQDLDLLGWGASNMQAELDFRSRGFDTNLRLSLLLAAVDNGIKPAKSSRLEKKITINGVTQKSTGDLLGRLLIVSFSSTDLNLLRGGPKYRRDWLDSLILKLKPLLQESFANYRKSVAQRNRLLKSIFERGKVTVGDQDNLVVWDKQVARFGAVIIKQRLRALSALLPLAERQQNCISREQENLSIRYMFKASDVGSEEQGFHDSEDESARTNSDAADSESGISTPPLSAAQLAAMEEGEIAKTLLKLFKERRYDEIRRKQTLLGPHRDDLVFCLNQTDAATFASQGQQRSIVLALKLAELELIKSSVDESPVLLLDDVLAELDEFRQGLLMSAVQENSQTIITTTHLSGFDPQWLQGATVFKVQGGQAQKTSAELLQAIR